MADAAGSAKLALGTVQWGMRYGIAGRGQPDSSEVGAILAAARAAGVSLLDTAYAYGSAEQVIGGLHTAAGDFDIVTKTLPVRAPEIGAGQCAAVEAALEESLARLGRAAVYAVLVHDAGDLLAPGGDRLWEILERFRSAGKIRRIGVSVYNPDQCSAVAAAFPIEIVRVTSSPAYCASLVIPPACEPDCDITPMLPPSAWIIPAPKRMPRRRL